MKRLILCDMDGVLANNAHREHLLPSKDDCNTTEKWDAFNNACDQDEPIEQGFHLLMEMSVFRFATSWALWSGRTETVQHKSAVWFDIHAERLFKEHGYQWSFNQGRTCYFRPANDHRKAADCKASLAQQAVLDAGLEVGDELILIDDDLSVLEECRKFFPNAICIWIGNSHCSAKANGVTTK